MKELTVRELIVEAIEESFILECAMTKFDTERMLLNAMRLSGAPYSFIQDVYEDHNHRIAEAA